jgi:hypothetical protein
LARRNPLKMIDKPKTSARIKRSQQKGGIEVNQLNHAYEEFSTRTKHFKKTIVITDEIYQTNLEEFAFQAGFQLNLETVFFRNIGNKQFLIAYSSTLRDEIISAKNKEPLYCYMFAVHEIYFTEVESKKKYLTYDHAKGHVSYTSESYAGAADDPDRHTDSVNAKILYIDGEDSEIIDKIAKKIENFLQKNP